MRIAVISRNFARAAGGAESYAVAIAAALARRHEVHVFAQECPVAVDGITFHRVWRFSQRPRWLNQLFFALATWWATRRGYDVVHSHENTWQGQVQTIHVRPLRYNLLQVQSGVALALQWLKVLTSPRLLTYTWLEKARFAPRPGRSVVATSEALLQECREAYPQAEGSYEVITPGTTLPEVPNDPTTARARRTALGLPDEGIWLLVVANDYRRKGLDALLRALARLPGQVHLMVAGKPGAAPRYVEQAGQLGLQGRVHFLGSRQDLGAVYSAADLLVHPTLEDTYAMVVLEAMAHALPVVVSGPAHCGIARHLVHGQEALNVDDPTDDVRLAELVQDLVDQPAKARALGERARAFAATQSWEHAALQYEALCLRAVRGAGPGQPRSSTP